MSKKSTFIARTALEKHCAFFDRNKDGLLTPWETFAGFRALGYNLLLSLIGTVAVHAALSYPTLDSWWPDPFFTIHLKNIHRCRHGSDSAVYDDNGEMRVDRADLIMALYEKQGMGSSEVYLGFWEGVRMICENRDVWDLFGWVAAVVEWLFMFILCADSRGRLRKEDILAQYDETLFYKIEAERSKYH